MKSLIKIVGCIISMFYFTSGFTQNSRSGTFEDAYSEYMNSFNDDDTSLKHNYYSGSMETGYWKYLAEMYQEDPMSLDASEKILFYESDTMWTYMDSLYKRMARRYDSGDHFISFKKGKEVESYYISNVNDTFTIVATNLAQTDGKYCVLRFYLSYTTFFLEEEYNTNAGYYYMLGTYVESKKRILSLIQTFLKT